MMIQKRFLVLILWAFVCFSPACGQVHSTYTSTPDIVYGQALNNNGINEDLKLDLYVPDNNITARPLIVLIHGGSFLGGDKAEMTEYCKYFAQRNFVAVSINYRLGWNTGGGTCTGDMETLKQAGYRAVQDARAAIRYLVNNATTYKINTDSIFAGGASAGGVTALSMAYMDQSDFNTMYPGMEATLGGINTSGNSLTNSFHIKAVVNMWGGITDPSVVSNTERTPVISFHGTADNIVPYNVGTYNNCSNYMTIYGSKAVYDLLSAKTVATVLHSEPDGGHGVFDVNFIGANTYCFLNNVMNNQPSLGNYTGQTSSCINHVFLPLRFTSFTVSERSTGLFLEWAVAGNGHVKNFTVERSRDNKEFSEIGNVKANHSNVYTFQDTAPLEGRSFYRIKQTETNSAITYSKIKEMSSAPPSPLALYQSGGTITIKLTRGSNEAYGLYEAGGRRVHNGYLAGGELRLSKLSKGFYLLRILGKEAEYIRKIVVE